MKYFTIQLKRGKELPYKNKYPLLIAEACKTKITQNNEGLGFLLTDPFGKFIGKGIIGFQNKGIGWLLTYNKFEEINLDLFKSRFTDAFSKRYHLFQSEETNAFRIFNGEGDGVGGITIDYYDGNLLIQWYSKGMYDYKKEILEAIKSEISFNSIYEKKRFAQAGKYIEADDFVCGNKVEFPIIIKENRVNYSVNLNDGAMTGIFLDQRKIRKLVMEKYSKDKIVLNTFSYTGAFSTAAIAGKAKKTVSVDLANRSKELTINNFIANCFNEKEQEIRVFDVFKYFPYAEKKGLEFDLVILDPPSFAKSKKFIFKAEKDYSKLVEDAIKITKENGIILASTNCARFGMKKFLTFIEKAFSNQNKDFKILEKHSLSEDFAINNNFPEGNYLKVVFVKCL